MIFHRARREEPNLPNLPSLVSLAKVPPTSYVEVTEYLRRVHQVLSCTCACTSTSSYLTLPNLQVSYIPTYLPTVCRNHLSRESFIHPLTYSLPPSLPSSLPLAGLVYVCVCTCASVRPCISVYLSVYIRVSVRVHTTYIQYPQKVHIKDTYQRYMYTCVLGYVVVSYFKNNICRSDRHKKTTRRTSVHPPCLSQLHSVNLCASQSKISLSNWCPKTTVCLAR